MYYGKRINPFEIRRGSNVDIEKYFEELNDKLDDMSDEEFKELLIQAGIENCPLLESKE